MESESLSDSFFLPGGRIMDKLKHIIIIRDAMKNAIDKALATNNDRDLWFQFISLKVFSPDIADWISENYPEIEEYWRDPDTSCEADVMSYYYAVRDMIDSLNSEQRPNENKNAWKIQERVDKCFVHI